MTKRKQTAGRGVRDREKGRLRRWVSQALSWVTYTYWTHPPGLHASAPPPCTHSIRRTSFSVVSTRVLSLQRTSFTCTRIWKTGQL